MTGRMRDRMRDRGKGVCGKQGRRQLTSDDSVFQGGHGGVSTLYCASMARVSTKKQHLQIQSRLLQTRKCNDDFSPMHPRRLVSFATIHTIHRTSIAMTLMPLQQYLYIFSGSPKGHGSLSETFVRAAIISEKETPRQRSR